MMSRPSLADEDDSVSHSTRAEHLATKQVSFTDTDFISTTIRSGPGAVESFARIQSNYVGVSSVLFY